MLAHVLQSDQLRILEDPAQIRDAALAGAPLWLDLDQKSEEAEKLFLEVFKLHPLCIEDIWSEVGSPKVEDFGSYIYVLVEAVGQGRVPSLFEKLDLDIVIGKNFVITHHRQPLLATKAVVEELKRSPRLLQKGSPWLAHSLLDHLVDDYSPLIETLDNSVEELERDIMAYAGTPQGKEILSKIFDFKRSLQELRRLSVHQREVLFRLSRGEFPAIPVEALPFYRDVFDHIARAVDLLEGYRDLVTSALDAYLSVQSNRMNEIIKALTVLSTVMLPLTFITGVFGMNVKVPGMDTDWGLPLVFIIMVGTAIFVLAWFKGKKWI